MKKWTIFIVFLISFGSQLKGQSVSSLSSFYNKYFTEKKKQDKEASKYMNIQGSPYENIHFEEGVVYMKDGKSYAMPLRHNIFENTFEFKIKTKVLNITNPDEVIRIELGEKTYVYFPVNNKKFFVQLLVSGQTNLVRKVQVIFKPAEKPSAYKEMKPPRFRRNKDLFYLIDNQGSTFLIKNKKSFLKHWSERKEELEKFIKEEKISFKNEDDLQKLVKFYNEPANFSKL